MSDLWYWLTIGDGKVCPDCIERGDTQPQPWDDWMDQGLPREGATQCGFNCRCQLVPARVVGDEIEIDADAAIDDAIERTIDKLMQGVKFDKMNGKVILLQDFKDATGLKDLSLADAARFDPIFEELTELITRYNVSGRTLPLEYYSILSLIEKLAWLRVNV